MKKYLEYIKEIFNTKTYKWIKSDYSYRKIAEFYLNNVRYIVHIDNYFSQGYNLVFYREENGEFLINLINDNSNKSFKVLSNIKASVDEFIQINKEWLELIGFSSEENERHDLYLLFCQNINKEGFKYKIIETNKKTYYFIYKEDLPFLLLNNYIDKYIQEIKKK